MRGGEELPFKEFLFSNPSGIDGEAPVLLSDQHDYLKLILTARVYCSSCHSLNSL